MEAEAENPSRDAPDTLLRGRILRLPEISDENVRKAVRLHRKVMAGGPGGMVVKRATKTNVTLLDWEGENGPARLCVKEFVRAGIRRFLPNRIRHRPAYRSWHAARFLAERGIGAPLTLAVLIGRKERSYLIMREIVNAQHLRSYAKDAVRHSMPLARRRNFLNAGAAFLARCYAGGVFHEDLKATNVFITEPDGASWRFALLDLAAVRVPAHPRRDDKLLNLAQLNASTPLEITRTDRLRFLKRVAELDRSLQGRDTVDEIMRLTRRRGGVWLQ
jgi:hypothetical protein